MSKATTMDAELEAADAVPLSRAVVEAVADAEAADPTELDPLYHVIDPDGLDALFRSRGSTSGDVDAAGEITFGYHGYEVRVTATGRVELTEQ